MFNIREQFNVDKKNKEKKTTSSVKTTSGTTPKKGIQDGFIAFIVILSFFFFPYVYRYN